jgi:hypothetical protein
LSEAGPGKIARPYLKIKVERKKERKKEREGGREGRKEGRNKGTKEKGWRYGSSGRTLVFC